MSPLKAGKQKITRAFAQTKESLRILQTLEKEAIGKAKSWIGFPNFQDQRAKRSERILKGLRKLGLATQQDLSSLSAKIENLESKLNLSKPKRKREKTTSRSSKTKFNDKSKK